MPLFNSESSFRSRSIDQIKGELKLCVCETDRVRGTMIAIEIHWENMEPPKCIVFEEFCVKAMHS